MEERFKCLDYFIWKRIFDDCDYETLVNVGLTNLFFTKLVAERVYKHRCVKNQVYRLRGETWKEAFKDLPNRVTWEDDDMYSRVQFCREDGTDRFLYVGDDHVVVTSFDKPMKFIRFLSMKSHPRRNWAVSLIKKGELIVSCFFYWYGPKTVQVYSVKAGKYIFTKRFSWYVSCANGAAYDKDAGVLFNGYDQSLTDVDIDGDLKDAVYGQHQHLFYFKGPKVELLEYNAMSSEIQRRIELGVGFATLDWSKYLVVHSYGRLQAREDGEDRASKMKKEVLEIYETNSSVPALTIDLPPSRWFMEVCPGVVARFPKFKDENDNYALFTRNLQGHWSPLSKPFKEVYSGRKGLFRKARAAANNLVWVVDPLERPKPFLTWDLVYFENLNGELFCKRYKRKKMRYLLIYGVIVISISVNGTLALICHCTERFSNYDGYGEVVPCINNTCEVGKRGSCMMLRSFEDDNTAFRCVKDYRLRNDCEDFMMSYAKGTVCTCNTGDDCNIHTWFSGRETNSEEENEMENFIQATVEKMAPFSYGNPLYDGNVKKSDYENYENAVKLSLKRKLVKEKREEEERRAFLEKLYGGSGKISASRLALVTTFILFVFCLV
ncbi:unnamed protein product [Bursaphelenchus xylophilus]|nr:unnamed protein product [Bursaphelenchus xylophilus]CAG9120774.1 unnamed protein product [Bursaphelenchus xylophilus]